ncbi:MAG: cation transporter, partial [Marinobacter sp.]
MSSVNTESGKPGCHKDTDNNAQHHNHEHGSDPHVHVDSAAHQELIIEGAGCASCVGKIESALKAVPGVENAEMNFA